VPGGATSQSTIVPGVATTTATAGSVAQGTGFTYDQVLDLFVRYFKRPGPPQGTIIFHPTQASYEAAEQAAGYQAGETLGFFDTALELVHLPPTVSDLTAMHEALHMIGRQSGVEGVLGRYVEEGLTEWLARSLGPVAERRAYDGNVAFVRLLANIVGEETLRNAYLHRLWEPLRSALRTRLGSETAVQHLYHQLKQVGPQGENGRVLQGVFDMLWPGSSTAEPLTTTAPAPAATTGGAVSASVPATLKPPSTPSRSVGAPQISQMIEEEVASLAHPGSTPLWTGSPHRQPGHGAVQTTLDIAGMREYVLDVWRQNPILHRLMEVRRARSPARHQQILDILRDFERIEGVPVETVVPGIVQRNTLERGNLASLRSRPGVLQIEIQAYADTDTLIREVIHELCFHYAGGPDHTRRLGTSGMNALRIFERAIETGEGENFLIRFLPVNETP
jgi:hypothetical protein